MRQFWGLYQSRLAFIYSGVLDHRGIIYIVGCWRDEMASSIDEGAISAGVPFPVLV